MAEEDILREIGSISRALDSIANIEFKDLELNRGQYLYLTRVFEHPGIISDHLAILLNIDRTTTARGIRKLEQIGRASCRERVEREESTMGEERRHSKKHGGKRDKERGDRL